MEEQFKQIAGLIGDPTRAVVMWTLFEGKAFTATELAMAADTTPQNMSMHLAKLVQANLLSVESQGRHRYYKYASKEVAYAIEALGSLIPAPGGKPTAGNNEQPAIKQCRTCYDHLAGKIGVAVTDSLLQQKIVVQKNNLFELSPKGKKWFGLFDIDIAALQQQRRSFLRPCLDWSERRYHMAGALPAAFLQAMLSADWLRTTQHSRALVVTAGGRKKLYEHFKIVL